MKQEVTNQAPDSPPIRVAIAAVLRPGAEGQPEVLAAWRSRNSVRGGVWEFPGGKVESNESAADAARRETFEELGIEIEIVRSVAVAEDFDPTQPREHHVAVELMLASCGAAEPTTTTRAWRWMSLKELDEHRWPRANAALIAALKNQLTHPAGQTTNEG
jgi:mutator protein MutT